MYGTFLPLPKERRFIPWNAIGYLSLWTALCLPSAVLPFGWWLGVVWAMCGVLALAPWVFWRVVNQLSEPRHNL